MLVTVATLAFKCRIRKHDSCETAYEKYLKCYPEKDFSSERRDIFCSRFAVLVGPDCKSCDITPMMDMKFVKNTKFASRSGVERKEYSNFPSGCTLDESYELSNEIMTPLETIWSSMDLSEAKLVTPARD